MSIYTRDGYTFIRTLDGGDTWRFNLDPSRVDPTPTAAPVTPAPTPLRMFERDSQKLERYCSHKWARASDFYNECIADGWKDWYANAEWMK